MTAACVAPYAAQLSAAAQSGSPHAGAAGYDAVLNPGDVVRIAVWRKPEMSGEFIVGPDSAIVHPLYREVKVAGIPLASAEERVRAFLARFEANPAFTMAPLFRVVVGGEVRQPNLYTLPPATSVAQAVALAGGPTERGRLDQVRIARQGRVVMVDLMRPDASAAEMPIRSGDQILVGRRRMLFRDVIAPASSVIGAMAAIASIVIR